MHYTISSTGACLGLVALARTCVSHEAALPEKRLHRSVLVGFGTRHEFRNELTMSPEVPLYLKLRGYLMSMGKSTGRAHRWLQASSPLFGHSQQGLEGSWRWSERFTCISPSVFTATV